MKRIVVRPSPFTGRISKPRYMVRSSSLMVANRTPPSVLFGFTVTVIAKSLGNGRGRMVSVRRCTFEFKERWNAGRPSGPSGPSVNSTPGGEGIDMALVKSMTFSSSRDPERIIIAWIE